MRPEGDAPRHGERRRAGEWLPNVDAPLGPVGSRLHAGAAEALTLSGLPKVWYDKNKAGDYDVRDESGAFLLNVWRPYHHPSRWLVNVGNAPFPNGTRREAVEFGLEVLCRRDLLPYVP